MAAREEQVSDRVSPPPLSSQFFKIYYGASDDRLREFYIPALERSVRFDRTTGFFSSAALAIAAAGVSRLIRNGGKMRILCGAQLSEDDVEAIRKGTELEKLAEKRMLEQLDLEDDLLNARLEALAWMIAEGTLEIRVVLPKGPDGHPLPANEAREYYHPKEGVFEDTFGNKLAFTGSSNESVNGWQWNYETFHVYTTWPRKIGQDDISPSPYFITPIERSFDRLWNGKEDDWIAFDVPKAAREKLLKLCPAIQPELDPLEEEASGSDIPEEEIRQQEAIIFTYLKEAPFLTIAAGLGVETSAVEPWPHQSKIISSVIDTFPRSYMFCDEVGLGKTIEAGLALRQLVISERVKRALLLVPKSVQRQWQEELYEKFLLNIPRYDGGRVIDVFGQELEYSRTEGPWNSFPLLLASSQLVKRRDRQAELLEADPWDLIIVDEAHHARRKDFRQDIYRPNRLLELLMGSEHHSGLRKKTRCIYLLTATPMQIHPIEVWDLLRVVGIGGMWGACKENFLNYFQELREPFDQKNWNFILDMVRDYLESGGKVDQVFAETAIEKIGLVDWETIRSLPSSQSRSSDMAKLADTTQRACLEQFVKIHTPIHSSIWRSTRDLLRKYRERGLLDQNVPRRIPRNEWIELREGAGEEKELYGRIEEYISDFYRKYESERKGLGFVMTIYRRRLTSSFYALKKSLERRKKFLIGTAGLMDILTDDDTEQDELDWDITEMLEGTEGSHFAAELSYVEDFLRDLEGLSGDTKFERLCEDIREFFSQRDKIILFTQYADTMDYLRDALRHVYGSQVACYSGRGGEKWNGLSWILVPKEQIKKEFKEGTDIRILVCTESASEGLNLQTCGVLINYDMPWNPMRVEQRIGRIDRIGQEHEEVWIRNYFYDGTVEARVYQALTDRIEWFEDVVGELQPILHRVADAIHSASMASFDQRESILEREIREIRQLINTRTSETLLMEDLSDNEVAELEASRTPVSLASLESALKASHALGARFSKHPEIDDAYLLDWRGQQQPVTFNREVFDEHSYTVTLLSYGAPLLQELLETVSSPVESDDPEGVALLSSDDPRVSGFFLPEGPTVRELRSLEALIYGLSNDLDPWSESLVRRADDTFRKHIKAFTEKEQDAIQDQLRGEMLALREEARVILKRAAYIRITESQRLDLTQEDRPPMFFDERVYSTIAEENNGIPYRGLLSIAETPPRLSATDPDYGNIQNLRPSNLVQAKSSTEHQGLALLKRYGDLNRKLTAEVMESNNGAVFLRWLKAPIEADRS